MSQNITTGVARFSYLHVFTPKKGFDDNSDEKYSVALLIPKSDTATYNAVMAGIEEARKEGLTGVFKGAIPPGLMLPINDGDGVKPVSGEPYGQECKGCWVLSAANKLQPSVVDDKVQPILQQSLVYSGCYGRASVRFFPYAQGRKGIGCSLNGIQKLMDGEALGGGISPEEAFGGSNSYGGGGQQGAWPGAAPNYGAPAYQQPAMPAQPQYTQAHTASPSYQQSQYQQPYQGAPGYQQPLIDPITGRPLSGGVMGI